MVDMNLNILGMALARVLAFGVSSPLVRQKLAMSPNVGKKSLDSKSLCQLKDSRLVAQR